MIVMIYVGAALMLMRKAFPRRPAGTGRAGVDAGHLAVHRGGGGVVAIIFLEGFAGVLPDDPAGYHPIEQFR